MGNGLDIIDCVLLIFVLNDDEEECDPLTLNVTKNKYRITQNKITPRTNIFNLTKKIWDLLFHKSE